MIIRARHNSRAVNFWLPMTWIKANRAPVLLALTTLITLAVIARLNPRYMWTGDPLNKLIQSYSLVQNDFRSQQLFYPGKSFDPEFRFYPHPGVYLVKMPDGFYGQYSGALTWLGALIIKASSPLLLPYVSALFTLLCFYFLWRWWKLRFWIFFYALWGTWILGKGIEWSEYNFALFLILAGFTLYLRRGFKSPGEKSLGGLLFGLAAFLRLEALVLLGCLGLAALLELVLFARTNRARRSRELRAGLFFGAGAIVAAVLFFAVNYANYGHILGIHYMSNQAGFMEKSLEIRLTALYRLIFGGALKLGFFGYAPLLLLGIIAVFLPGGLRRAGRSARLLTFAILPYMPLVALLSADDGTVLWGPRYLLFAVFPALIVANRMARFYAPARLAGWRRASLKTVLVLIFAFSTIASLVWLQILGVATRQLRNFQTQMLSLDADVLVFQSPFLASHSGMAYFDRTLFVAPLLPDATELMRQLQIKLPGKKMAFLETRPDRYGQFTNPAEQPGWAATDLEAYRRILDEQQIFVNETETDDLRVRFYTIKGSSQN